MSKYKKSLKTGVIRILKAKNNRQDNCQKIVQKYKRRSLKHTHKTKDRLTRIPTNTGNVSSSWSTSETRRVNLVTNPVINHERGKDREVEPIVGVHLWHRYAIAINQVMMATTENCNNNKNIYSISFHLDRCVVRFKLDGSQ